MKTQRPIAPAPDFFALKKPSSDYAGLMNGLLSKALVFELDLSIARNFADNSASVLTITGNSFYVDQAPDVGTAYVQFEGVPDKTDPLIQPAFYVQAGWTARVPYHTLRIANTAQSGKKLRIMYGTDIDFIPSLNGQVAITGSVNATPYGMPYTAAYKSLTSQAAATPDTVFAPGANPNGAIVWAAGFASNNTGAASAFGIGFVAKTSAPATVIDGDTILLPTATPTGANFIGELNNPVFIAAGKGLYFISALAETAGFASRRVLYTLQ